MAKIFYAVCGEGRGHATRARALVEDLRSDHQIVLYAAGFAHDLLAPFYRGTDVQVRAIPGLRFFYSATQKVDYLRTGLGNWQYIKQFRSLIQRLTRQLEKEAPDLVLTDFEPSLPRAAKRCGIPFVSLDHQHFLLTADLRSLPLALRGHAAFMAQIVKLYYTGQEHTVVSSFYSPPVKLGLEDVTHIGVLLRPEILALQPEKKPHLVAYLRRFSNPEVLRALETCGCEVRVYGLGARPSQGNLRFQAIDIQRFAEDLASCRALISTAGNQLVGEALYLNKPVLAMPEPGNREQEINAHFLQRSGAGMVSPLNAIMPAFVREFLDSTDQLVEQIDRQHLYGNPRAAQIIRRYLPDTGVLQVSAARPERLPLPALQKRAIS